MEVINLSRKNRCKLILLPIVVIKQMPLEINTLLLPDENDILLTDVTESQIHSVKMELEVQNGTETNESHKYPIQGVTMGL